MSPFQDRQYFCARAYLCPLIGINPITRVLWREEERWRVVAASRKGAAQKQKKLRLEIKWNNFTSPRNDVGQSYKHSITIVSYYFKSRFRGRLSVNLINTQLW